MLPMYLLISSGISVHFFFCFVFSVFVYAHALFMCLYYFFCTSICKRPHFHRNMLECAYVCKCILREKERENGEVWSSKYEIKFFLSVSMLWTPVHYLPHPPLRHYNSNPPHFLAYLHTCLFYRYTYWSTDLSFYLFGHSHHFLSCFLILLRHNVS